MPTAADRLEFRLGRARPEYFGARGDGVTDDTAALAAWAACKGTHELVFPAGQRVYKTTAAVNLYGSGVRVRGAGRYRSRILVAGNNVGGIYFGGARSTLEGVGVTYETFATAAHAASIGLQLYRFHRGYVRDFFCEGARQSIASTTAVGVDGDNYAFSFTLADIEAMVAAQNHLFISCSAGQGNTQSVFSNLYFNNAGALGAAQPIAGAFVELNSTDGCAFQGLNLEHAKPSASLVKVVSGSDVAVFSGVHVEGIETAAPSLGIFENAAAVIRCTGLRIKSLSHLAANAGAGAQFCVVRYSGTGANTEIHGMSTDDAAIVTDIANAFRLGLGGGAAGTCVDCRIVGSGDIGPFLRTFAANSPATDPRPVLRRWDDTEYYREEGNAAAFASRRIFFSNTAPGGTAFTWAAGDVTRRASGAETNDGWVCTTGGAAGVAVHKEIGGGLGERMFAAASGSNPHTAAALVPAFLGEQVVNTTPAPREVWLAVDTAAAANSWRRAD